MNLHAIKTVPCIPTQGGILLAIAQTPQSRTRLSASNPIPVGMTPSGHDPQPRMDDRAGGAGGGDPERAQPLGEHAGVPQATGPAASALRPPINQSYQRTAFT